MALTHSVITLNASTATALNTDANITNSVTGEVYPTWGAGTISIQNIDSAITIYIGGAGVTSTSYGVQLPFGSSVTLDSLSQNEVVYAIAASGTPKVAVLMVTTA
jgi:hypothetical protein